MKRQKSKIFECAQNSVRVLTFVKMQGLGNDFILMDNLTGRFNSVDFASFARKHCSRNFGIGADGILVISPSKKADAKMKIINADGSEAEMCGNGIRCAAKYLLDIGYSSPVRIETLAGVKVVEKTGSSYRVGMGIPKVAAAPASIGRFKATLVDIGNPHCVIFVDNFDFDWQSAGEEVERNSMFPNRTNVEFVKVKSKKELEVKVWERGAGATLACGTGACASVAAAASAGRCGRKVSVVLPGGELEVELMPDNHVYLAGPAETVFSGEIAL